MLLKIQGPNLRDQSKGTFHVHSADCADNAKYEEDCYTYPLDLDSMLAVEDHIYGPDAGDFDLDNPGDWLYDFHFMPCTKGLPYGDSADYRKES